MYLYIIKQQDAKEYEKRAEIAKEQINCQRKYGDFSNAEAVHRMICDMAGGCKRNNKNLLYLEVNKNNDLFYIQSDEKIRKDIVENCGYCIVREKEIFKDDDFADNDFVEILCRLAPTKTVEGKKVSIAAPEKRTEWVLRKIEEAGSAVVVLQEMDSTHIMWSHSRAPINQYCEGWVNAYTYRMLVHAKDAKKLKNLIASGLGRGKAYGCGMMVHRVIAR